MTFLPVPTRTSLLSHWWGRSWPTRRTHHTFQTMVIQGKYLNFVLTYSNLLCERYVNDLRSSGERTVGTVVRTLGRYRYRSVPYRPEGIVQPAWNPVIAGVIWAVSPLANPFSDLLWLNDSILSSHGVGGLIRTFVHQRENWSVVQLG